MALDKEAMMRMAKNDLFGLLEELDRAAMNLDDPEGYSYFKEILGMIVSSSVEIWTSDGTDYHALYSAIKEAEEQGKEFTIKGIKGEIYSLR